MLETNENTFRFVLLLVRTNLIIFTCVSLLERNSYFNFEDSRVTQRRDEGNEGRGEERREETGRGNGGRGRARPKNISLATTVAFSFRRNRNRVGRE